MASVARNVAARFGHVPMVGRVLFFLAFRDNRCELQNLAAGIQYATLPSYWRVSVRPWTA